VTVIAVEDYMKSHAQKLVFISFLSPKVQEWLPTKVTLPGAFLWGIGHRAAS
jgi:hypothetical protein